MLHLPKTPLKLNSNLNQCNATVAIGIILHSKHIVLVIQIEFQLKQ